MNRALQGAALLLLAVPDGEAHPLNRQSSGGAHTKTAGREAPRATTGGSTGSSLRQFPSMSNRTTVGANARGRIQISSRTAVPVPWAPGRMRIRCRDRSRTSFVVKLPRRRAESPVRSHRLASGARSSRLPKSARLWDNGIFAPCQPTHWRQSGPAARAEAPRGARRTSIVAGRFAARPDVAGRVERSASPLRPGAHQVVHRPLEGSGSCSSVEQVQLVGPVCPHNRATLGTPFGRSRSISASA